MSLSARTHEVVSYQIQVLQYQSDFSHADWSGAMVDETGKRSDDGVTFFLFLSSAISLQSATKLVETLCPEEPLSRLANLEGGK